MTLEPYDLRCEYLHEPLGLDEVRPRLQWRMRSSVRGDRAGSVRVTVEPDGRPDAAWDTGWVDGRDIAVEYAGPPLRSLTRYRWTIATRDAAGEPGGEQSSWFETGRLDQAEWRACWIGADPEARPPVDPPQDDDILGEGVMGHLNRRLPPCAQLRREFTLDADVRRARLLITAKGLYEATINGRRVGDAELTPGWTDYSARIPYQCYDVTALVTSGENAIGVALADGWWSGRVGPDGRRLGAHYGRAPELLAELVIDEVDGRQQVIATDESWHAAFGPLRFADLLAGEYYDARREHPGWTRPGAPAAGWSPVMVHGADRTRLVAGHVQPVRATQTLAARDVEQRTDGRWLVDFGQNLVGRVRITVRDCQRGRAVTIRHGETCTADGELYVENLRLATATDVYRAGGAPVETYEPRFTFHGFRYAEIRGVDDLRAEDIVAVVLHSDAPTAGAVETSDDTVNQLAANIRWGQRGNFVSVPTDCPQRDERLGWLADAQVFAPTASYQADVAAFFAWWLRDVVTSRLPNGAFPDVAPRLVFERNGAPGWGDAGTIVPWHLWRTYGDRRTLEHCFDAMVGWVAHIHRANPDLLWRNAVGNHYGDWLQCDAETPRDLLATAYFARSTQLVAAAADVLGRTTVADQHRDLAERIADRFRHTFVEGDGALHDATQTGYLLALAFGLLHPEQEARAVEELCADIESRGNRLTTGFLGVGLLCPTLAGHGRADLAYALLHQDEYPSWNYSIRHGATTIWERWDGWTLEHGFQSVAMNSFNHYALGSIGEWLFSGVLGIDQSPDSIGYEQVVIQPQVGGRLTWARGHYESLRGRVECAWSRSDDGVTCEITIPPGSTALVRLPAELRTEGACPIERAPGVELVDAYTARVGSGHYAFVTGPLEYASR